jgi:hypothetical protein
MEFLINFYKKVGTLSKLKITLLAEQTEMKAFTNRREWKVVEKILSDIQSTKKAIDKIKTL